MGRLFHTHKFLALGSTVEFKLYDLLAVFIAIATVFAAYFVEDRIYERMAHFEDEMAYIWQAQVIAGGDLVLPSPPNPKTFLIPFVIDYNGQRFSKYPPGWPVILGIGFRTGLEDWVNPLLAGFGIWLLYLLAKRITTGPLGLLTVILMLTSPMFWMLSGSMLSHAWSLVLALGFVLAWLDTFIHKEHVGSVVEDIVVQKPPGWLPATIAGLSLGVLALTRPMDAVGVALPFFIHGIILLVLGDRSTRIRVLTVGLLAASVSGLLFAWQYALTGDALLNPYTLWWKYDKVGFGQGYGRWTDGHNLAHAWQIIKRSLWSPDGTREDVIGWNNLWWIFLPFGLWALRKKTSIWLVASIFPALVLAYVPYWTGSWEYGPRYYYEGMLSITVLSAAGVAWLAGKKMGFRKVLTGLLLIALIGHNLFTYLPERLWKMHGMYNIERTMLEPFYTDKAQVLPPVLILVHIQHSWTEYAGLLELQNAQLTTPFIFALYRRNSNLSEYYEGFPDRKLYHYFPGSSFTLYPDPRKSLVLDTDSTEKLDTLP